MAKFRVYIKPFADDAGSAYASEWLEISDDVVKIGDLSQQLDNTEYDIGIFRAANVSISLRNDHGRYGTAGSLTSIFKYRRGASKIRITWEPGDSPLACGFFFAGDPLALLTDEYEVFEGLLDDTASKSTVSDQTIDFIVQGYESLLAQMTVPYGSISNGDTLASAIQTMLDQAPFTDHVTVDGGNISTGASATIDDKTDLENKTVLEALKNILLASSSVLWVKEGVAYVAPRTEGATDAATFYGWASFNGNENILDISDFRTGENRVLNFITWKDTALVSQDATSVGLYGYRKKEISLSIITDTTKRNTLLAAVKNEFRNAKREFWLKTQITGDMLALWLLNKVQVDFPAEYVVSDSEGNVAIYGLGEYGVDYYSVPITRLEIEDTARFKILSRKISIQSQTLQFYLREV